MKIPTNTWSVRIREEGDKKNEKSRVPLRNPAFVKVPPKDQAEAKSFCLFLSRRLSQKTSGWTFSGRRLSAICLKTAVRIMCPGGEHLRNCVHLLRRIFTVDKISIVMWPLLRIRLLLAGEKMIEKNWLAVFASISWMTSSFKLIPFSKTFSVLRLTTCWKFAKNKIVSIKPPWVILVTG